MKQCILITFLVGYTALHDIRYIRNLTFQKPFTSFC